MGDIYNPLIMVGALKGAAISCLCAMSIARQTVSTQWLCSITNYAHQAVERGLTKLHEYQLAARVARDAWTLTTQGYQLAFVISPIAENQQLSSSSSMDKSFQIPNKLLLLQKPIAENQQSGHENDDSPVETPRGRLLANHGMGFLEKELRLADRKMHERRYPHAISVESIQAEIDATEEEGYAIEENRGLFVFRIRQLANGERHPRRITRRGGVA